MKLRSIFVKAFSIVFAVCAAFAIATITQSKTVNAEDNEFRVNGSSIYAYDVEGESKVGLRFEAEFTDAWLDSHTAEKYTFGMIIAPTANFEKAEADGAEKPWSKDNTPTINMTAVDGVNIIRIQNLAISEGDKFYAGILFDDDSLKATIAEKLGIEVSAVTDSKLESLKANIFKQGYSAVAYVTYGGKTEYLARYDTSMRETAAKTYALGVAEDNAAYKVLALPYLGLSESDVYTQSAYVALTDNKLVIDSTENFEIEEGDLIIADGKPLEYDIVDNAVILNETKPAKTIETLIILRDTDINVVEVAYVDVALSTAEEVANFVMFNDSWTYSESIKRYVNSKSAVLTQDIDMANVTLFNHVEFNYNGIFDGRGHVLSNVTVDTKDDENPKATTYGMFGHIVASGVIKNVAFNDIKAPDTHPNGAILGHSLDGLMENVYVSYSVYNVSDSGMFVLADSGVMRNVVILDNYYDPNFNVDTYISNNKGTWGVSPIVRALGAKSTTFENVQVISRRPVAFVCNGDDAYEVVYNPLLEDNPETAENESMLPATIKSWGSRVIYGENEEDLFVHYEYFYNKTAEEGNLATPGMGLAPGTATIENTKGTDKTVVKTGLRRYNDMAGFLSDSANANNRAALIATGFWKEDESGNIVWSNSDSISPFITIEYVDEVDYDASTGIMYTTALNGETIKKVTLNDVILTDEENGGLIVDEDGKIVGVRAKVNASDENLGIAYRDNKAGTSNVISYNNKLKVETTNKIIYIKNVNYYTQLIFNVTDLREAVGYNVDYSIYKSVEDEATEREDALNGKGYFVATTKDGSNYYEAVYNSGVYKMMANLDMEKAGIGYTDNDLNSNSKIGGFVGYFDGNGYTIANFKPDAQGLFGRVGTYLGGAVLAGTNATAGYRYVNCKPVIKNLALTDVITSYYDATNLKGSPILANLLGTNTYAASPHTTTVENIYVTVSSESTALGSLVTHLGGHTKMNNVYVVNPNEHNMIEVGSSVMYKMTDDPSRPTVENGTKVWNVMKNYKETADGVLFGWAYSSLHGTPGNDYIATGTLDNTTNVYVVSTMPINFSSKNSMFVYPGHSSYLPLVYSAENGIQFDRGNEFYKLGKACNNASNVYVAIAYASNEEKGRILIPYGFKQSMIDEMKAFVGSGASVPTYGPNYVYTCRVCGEIAIGGTSVNTAVDRGDCKYCGEGTYTSVENKSYVIGGNGRYATPCIYTFTVHAAADMGEYYSHTNGAFKLKGVYKYSDVDAMKNAVNDYSSFTGEAGNGMWEVVETKDGEDNVIARELKWVGRAA